MFVFSIIVFSLGLLALLSSKAVGRNEPAAGKGARLLGVAVILISLVMLATQSFYTQDVGESKVKISWTGTLQGQTTDAGLHFKAPWDSVRTYEVRNNLVAFVGPTAEGGQPNYSGNVTTGPQITFQDKEGVTGNMDITVRYSLDAEVVTTIYSKFGTQDNFVNKVIAENVREWARIAPSTRSTIQVYNDRADLSQAIMDGLKSELSSQGIIIEDVSVQEIRYSTDVTQRFDDAQAARIAVDRAQAEQEAAKVNADTLVIKAQGEADAAVVAAQGQADANAKLSESLTEAILTQRYIDALKAGTVYVVPEGSTPLIGANK